MENNQIHIEIKDGKVRTHSRKPLPIDDFLTVLFTAALGSMEATAHSVPEQHRAEAKGDIYDMFNAGASNILSMFAPEIELRPDLTVQAILEAENKIISESRAPVTASPTLKRIQ